MHEMKMLVSHIVCGSKRKRRAHANIFRSYILGASLRALVVKMRVESCPLDSFSVHGNKS